MGVLLCLPSSICNECEDNLNMANAETSFTFFNNNRYGSIRKINLKVAYVRNLRYKTEILVKRALILFSTSFLNDLVQCIFLCFPAVKKLNFSQQ